MEKWRFDDKKDRYVRMIRLYCDAKVGLGPSRAWGEGLLSNFSTRIDRGSRILISTYQILKNFQERNTTDRNVGTWKRVKSTEIASLEVEETRESYNEQKCLPSKACAKMLCIHAFCLMYKKSLIRKDAKNTRSKRFQNCDKTILQCESGDGWMIVLFGHNESAWKCWCIIIKINLMCSS